MEKKWYVLKTTANYEDKLKTKLENIVEMLQLQDKISRILIPTEDVMQVKKGVKKVTAKKKFSGYVLIEMVLDDETWKAVKAASGGIRFVGGKEPAPLQEDEVNRILSRMGEKSKPKIEKAFQKSEAVQVTWGPFTDFTGIVLESNEERGKVKVSLSIFGRETPVELDLDQVKRI